MLRWFMEAKSMLQNGIQERYEDIQEQMNQGDFFGIDTSVTTEILPL